MGKMKIYIGLTYDNIPMGLLLADSKDKAEIAWSAMKDMPHSIETIDPDTCPGINGLSFLLTSTETNSRDVQYRNSGIDFRIWKRGV